MAYCPLDCMDFTLIGTPTAGCEINQIRKRTPSRLAFFKCDASLPSEFTEATTAPLFTGNPPAIVVSPPLIITANDPEFEDVRVHGCAPPLQVLQRRVFDFEDRTRMTKAAVTGPPAEPEDPFFDYSWWENKRRYFSVLRAGIVFCNGDVVFARDEDGRMLEFSLNVFLSFQEIGNSGSIELKKGQISFLGDPLDLRNKPDFNLVDFGISV